MNEGKEMDRGELVRWLAWAMSRVVASAAAVDAYGWDAETGRREVREAFAGARAGLLSALGREGADAGEFWDAVWRLPAEERYRFGFRKWADGDSRMLVSLWIMRLLPEGYAFPDGQKAAEVDDDVRMGCVFKLV